MKLYELILGFLSILLIGFSVKATPVLEGKQSLQKIEILKQKTREKLQWVDNRIEKAIQSDHQSSKEILELGVLRKEYVLRLDLYNRLSLGVESHYKGGQLREFLSGYLRRISSIELKNMDKKNSLWEVTIYMSRALDKIPERFENPIDFIAAYVEFSSITSPKPPEQFVISRNYTNGAEYQSATPLTQSKVGLSLSTVNAPIQVEIRSKSAVISTKESAEKSQ